MLSVRISIVPIYVDLEHRKVVIFAVTSNVLEVLAKF